MRLLVVFITLLSISTAFAKARADVSLRNGNFFIAFRDLSYPGGMEPRIERIYNSKVDFTGMFGFSWGSQYETRLRIEADGSAIVNEFGGGADNRFVAKDYKQADLDAAVTTLTEAAKKAGIVTTAQQVAAYKSKVYWDAEYRSKQFQIFIAKSILPPKKIAEGVQLTSTKFFYQFITKVKGGYVRILPDGNIQKFDDAGHLVQLQDRNKNFINFAYNANGKMVSLVDNQNRKMQFFYNSQNLLEKITGESGKSAFFKYNKQGMLEYSKDESGVENTFAYTTDQFRNLADIGFMNEKDAKGKPKHVKIAYYGPDNFTKVKAVTNSDGTINEYDYKKDPKNPDYYGAHVVMKNMAGTKISDAKYDYFSKLKPGGEYFTSRITSEIDGDKKDEYFDEKTGFPIKIVNNGRVTTMAYDVKGRMTKKVTPIETTDLSYNATVGKVSKVTRTLKSGTVLWSSFDYDSANGNLTVARNSEKKQVKLVYDPAGRIRALIDQSGRQLTIKYNELSKPIEIADAKLGTIKITYKNSGEVDKMDSNGGASAASEVLRTLQNLIDITAPAGVSMSI